MNDPIAPFNLFVLIVAGGLGLCVALCLLALTAGLLYLVGSVTVLRLVRRSAK